MKIKQFHPHASNIRTHVRYYINHNCDENIQEYPLRGKIAKYEKLFYTKKVLFYQFNRSTMPLILK